AAANADMSCTCFSSISPERAENMLRDAGAARDQRRTPHSCGYSRCYLISSSTSQPKLAVMPTSSAGPPLLQRSRSEEPTAFPTSNLSAIDAKTQIPVECRQHLSRVEAGSRLSKAF